MYYLQSRYYDPNIGRFVNADEAEFATFENDILSGNLYSYCKNSIIVNYDFMGFYTLIIRRWMISSIVDFLLSLIPMIGVCFKPVASLSKFIGKAIYKENWKRTMLKGLESFKKIIFKVASKFWNLAYKVKILRKAFCKKSSTYLAEYLFGWLFSSAVTKFLNIAVNNADIFMSVGGIVAGLIDWAYDKKINNILYKIEI